MDESSSPKQKKNIIFSIDSILSNRRPPEEPGEVRSGSEEGVVTPETPKWCRERHCRRFAYTDVCGLLASNPGHSTAEQTRKPVLESKMAASASFFLDRTLGSRVQSSGSGSLSVGTHRWLEFGARSCSQDLRERLEAGMRNLPLKSEEKGEQPHLCKTHQQQESTGRKSREENSLKEDGKGLIGDCRQRGRFQEGEENAGRESEARGKADEADVERLMETNEDDEAEFENYFHSNFFNNGESIKCIQRNITAFIAIQNNYT